MINRYIHKTAALYSNNPRFFNALSLVSLFLSAALLLPLINILFDYKPAVEDFSAHVMSNAAFSDLDIAGRVSLYYKSFLVLLLLTAIVFGVLHLILKKRHDDERSENIVKTLSSLSVLGLMVVVAGLLQVNIDASAGFLAVVVLCLLYNLKVKQPWLNVESALWAVFVSLPFAVIAYQAVLLKYNELLSKQYIFDLYLPVIKQIAFAALLLVFTAIAYLVLYIYFKGTTIVDAGRKQQILFRASLPLMFVLILQSIGLEFCNIINVRTGHTINKPFYLAVAIIIFVIVFSWLRYTRLKDRHFNDLSQTYFERYYFPLVVISLGVLIYQPWRVALVENEFFESANHGLSVDHFFRYGMIPIVETFDAHMLSNQIFAYFYVIFNGYEPWAPFLYSNYMEVVIGLLGYYVFKQILGPVKALAVFVCIPFIALVFNHYIFSGLTALSLLMLIKNPINRSYYLFWFSAIAACLYKLDVGFATLTAGVITYVLASIILKQPLRIKKFAVTAAISFGSMLMLFMLLCLIKGINPFTRLHEFIITAMSNQNWGLESMGDKNLILFRILYHVMPLVLFALLTFTVLKLLVKDKAATEISFKPQQKAALVLFIFFSFIFFMNAPRGIVRHSLVSDIVTAISGTMLPALLCFIYIKKRKANFIIFLSVIAAYSILFNFKKQTLKEQYQSNLSLAVNSGAFFQNFTPAADFGGTRVLPNFDVTEINVFKNLLDQLLTQEETYFDFSSTNYFHALTGRKNPMYVNQTPLLLNGDKAQEYALKQLEEANVPVVIMPKAGNIWNFIDGIPVEFKYYKITEYIYRHYTPLLQLSSFDVYVAKDRKNKYENLIKAKNVSTAGGYVVNDFSAISFDAATKNSLVAEKQGNLLVLKPQGPDPFIHGFMEMLQVKDKVNPILPVGVKITAEVAAPGTMQLFYLMGENEPFSEEKSKTFTLASGPNTIVLELNALPKDIRIDIDTQPVTIRDIAFKNPEVKQAETQQADMDLGSIPRLWGEKANHEIFDKIPTLPEEIVASTVSKNIASVKRAPGYLYIEMEADTIHRATVALLGKDNVKKTVYAFSTQKGRHAYAVRLSANYYWWNGNIAKLALQCDKPVKITKFAYISENGRDMLAGVENNLTLSNLTDTNWFGGVGITYNIFLLDNSAQNIKSLQQGKYIQLADGRKATIKSVQPAGAYIHVEILEDVQQYKQAAAYPNTIKIV